MSPAQARLRSARADGQLARLPVFFALDGRRAMVAGGSRVRPGKPNCSRPRCQGRCLCAEAARGDLDARRAAAGEIVIHRRDMDARRFRRCRHRGRRVRGRDEAAAFAAAARAAGVPVNVIDKPEFCDFAFGAIVNRSPLVIGISTDGAAPVFGQAIRAKLEAMIPPASRNGRKPRAAGARELQASGFVPRAPPVLAALHRRVR